MQIIRYANRLEIRNAGFSLKSQDHLGEPGSELRNPKIASALYDTRLAETKGSGIRVMRESMAVREAGALNNSTYSELAKVDALTASQALCRLRDAGLLAQKGRGSATYYVPTDKLLDEGLSDNIPPLSTNPDRSFGNSDALSTKLGGLSTKLTSTQDAQRSSLLNELPGTLAAKIGAIGQRHPPSEVCNAIVEICRLRAWRAEELAILLQRHSRYVRNNYLRPLMRDGRLMLTNSDEPSDPQQAYRTDG